MQGQREHLKLGWTSASSWIAAPLYERIGTKLDAERRRCRLGFLSLMQSTHGGAYPHLAYLQSGTHGDAYPHLAYLREWHVDLQCA